MLSEEQVATDEALGSVVDGSNDFGVDALLYEEPDDGTISMLEPLFDDRRRPRTLQRLSATFRRADLVEMLRT